MAAAMTMFVGFIPAMSFFVVSLIAAWFSVWWGAVGYTGAIYISFLLIVGSCACIRPPDDFRGFATSMLFLSPDETRIYRRHYAFFRFPFGTQNFAHFINFARIFGTVWFALTMWQGIYWVAGALAGFFVISGPVMLWLMPIAHYKAAAGKGDLFAMKKLSQIEHILEHRDSLGF